MLYEILINEFSDAVVDVENFDNPREARAAFESLRERFGSYAVTLVRDNCPITEAQLAVDVESYVNTNNSHIDYMPTNDQPRGNILQLTPHLRKKRRTHP